MCDTCKELNEGRDVVRQHNRAQRSVIRVLRRKTERLQEHGDQLFAELCNTNPSAEEAMRQLWERAGFKCSPENYEFMVEMAVRCINDAIPDTPGISANRDPEAAE